MSSIKGSQGSFPVCRTGTRMRLDKFLCEAGAGTRSEVKQLLKKGVVTVNGMVEKAADKKVEETDRIALRGRELSYTKFRYYLLHKPSGVITATEDKHTPTVMGLLQGIDTRGLFPVGRLDKDTEGLLLLTNDGALAHRLLSPRKHVDKRYLVRTRQPLSEEAIGRLTKGDDIGDEKETMPAKVKRLADAEIELTIREGRFHQVKRMLSAVGNEVVYLKRLSIGSLQLPEDLEAGGFRELTKDELSRLQKCGRLNAREGKGTDDMQKAENSLKAENPLKKRIPAFEAIIFDLDGTLVDSMWMWEKIDIEYLERFGIALPCGLQNAIEGMSFSETAAYFKERFQLTDSLETIKADWNEMAGDKYRNEVPFKEKAPEFLEYCKELGIKLGIATSNSKTLVESAAEALSLRRYFSCVMTACEVNKGKPAPDIYLAVAKALGVNPEKCLVFEDILPGIQAGKNAGMQVCAVEDVYSADIREEKRRLADFFIESYEELL